MTFKSVSQLYGYNTPQELASAIDELNDLKREMKSFINRTNQTFEVLGLK